MLNNRELLDFVNFLTRKETEGRTMTPEQYNILLPFVSIEHFENEFNRYEKDISSTDTFKDLRRTKTLTITNGITDMFPDDYYHMSSVRTKRGKVVDLLTDMEWDETNDDYVLAPTEDYPIARFVLFNDSYSGSYNLGHDSPMLQVMPTSISKIDITYLKTPNTPFYDYYIDANGIDVFLPTGTVHTWANGETDSYGNSKSLGDPDYTSRNIDLEWEDDDRVKIAYLVCQKIGVNIPDPPVTQYSQFKEIQYNK